jgi:hypothetical protein
MLFILRLKAMDLFWRLQQSPKPLPREQAGIAYLAVLFLVAAIAVAMAVVTRDIDMQLKREKEQDWFFVGNQYQQAIASYYHQSPDGLKALPKNIEDLLLDKRFIRPVRHLRKAYRDPLTNQAWELVRDADNSLIGVRSLKQGSIISLQLVQRLKLSQDKQGAENVRGAASFDADAQDEEPFDVDAQDEVPFDADAQDEEPFDADSQDEEPFDEDVGETLSDKAEMDEPKEPLQGNKSFRQYNQVFYMFKPKQEALDAPISNEDIE